MHQFYPYIKVPCYSPFDGPLAQSTQKFQHDITFVLIPLFIAPPKKFVGFCASKEQNAVNVLCNWKSNEIALFLRCDVRTNHLKERCDHSFWSWQLFIVRENAQFSRSFSSLLSRVPVITRRRHRRHRTSPLICCICIWNRKLNKQTKRESHCTWLTGRPRAICGQRYPFPCSAWF